MPIPSFEPPRRQLTPLLVVLATVVLAACGADPDVDALDPEGAAPPGGAAGSGASSAPGGDAGSEAEGGSAGEGASGGSADPGATCDSSACATWHDLYVDLNAPSDGDGSSPGSPRNVIPDTIGDSCVRLLFNSDGGRQAIPGRDNAIVLSGAHIRVSSYGSSRAVLSAYEELTDGWKHYSGTVYYRDYTNGYAAAGPVVGNVIHFDDTTDSPHGSVLAWTNLEAAGDAIGAFLADPGSLGAGAYAYDWRSNPQRMYVNIGSDPNVTTLGVARVGRFINTAGAPRDVEICNLSIIGFCRAAINITGAAADWSVHHNDLYAIGGMYNVKSGWYHGSGIQLAGNASGVEIRNNSIVQTYDSPITPQHFAGESGNTIADVLIRDNHIDRWALAAVELADWGTSDNHFRNIEIVNNVMESGGRGFSGLGDSPLGHTDGIHFRGNVPGSTVAGIAIVDNDVRAPHAALKIAGGTFVDGLVSTGNLYGEAEYGVRNQRPNDAHVTSTADSCCQCGTEVADGAAASAYFGFTTLDSCP
ncbi:MAG: hypothetical protein JRI23_14350 [Deltaproteobacteria bacterium]|jgi:hypothetical protein|nr:hypothetical protein [Deltaproteobacteria bacterium]MBW2532926.1 hypothetical protein [Deltaproteobacteria bacterium]